VSSRTRGVRGEKPERRKQSQQVTSPEARRLKEPSHRRMGNRQKAVLRGNSGGAVHSVQGEILSIVRENWKSQKRGKSWMVKRPKKRTFKFRKPKDGGDEGSGYEEFIAASRAIQTIVSAGLRILQGTPGRGGVTNRQERTENQKARP